MKIFKIRNTRTGLYSCGGSMPSFTKKGKSWKCIGHIKNHIHNIRNPYKKTYMNECELVIIEYTETEKSTRSMIDVIKETEDGYNV